MTATEKQKVFIELRDLCNKPFEFELIDGIRFSKGDEYALVHKGLEKTGCFDRNYLANLDGKDGYEMAENPEQLTFEECCTVLTFLLRAERFSEGLFDSMLENKTIYKLLKRAVEVM